MSESAELPSAGYRIHKFYAVHQQQELVQPKELRHASESREVSFAWDWRVLDPQFEVFLGVTVGPSRSCGERLVYEVVGTFDCSEETPSIPLANFVAQNAIATLLPFVREGLLNLSVRGPFGPYYLPSINAVKLATRFNYEASTGLKQLEIFPEFRRRMLPGSALDPQHSVSGA